VRIRAILDQAALDNTERQASRDKTEKPASRDKTEKEQP
jgi:hypothetical protein